MSVDKFGRTTGAKISYKEDGEGISFVRANNTFLKLDGRNVPVEDTDMNSNKLVNVTDPLNPQDAATKQYVDINSGGGAKVSKDGDTMQGVLNMNNFPLTGLRTGMGTGSDAISWSDAIQLNDTKVNIAGDTMTGNLFISANGGNDRVFGCTDLIQN